VRRSLRVRDLVKETGLSLDEVLVTLWDVGASEVSGLDDEIPSSAIKSTRQAFGLPGRRDVMRCEFWQRKLKMSDEEFNSLLIKLQINRSSSARNLPRGGIQKLRRHAASQGIELIRTKVENSVPKVRPKESELKWQTIGKIRDVRCLDIGQILAIHDALVEDFRGSDDPLDPPGPRDIGLVESSAGRPLTSIGDIRKYESVEMAAAAFLHSLVLNHGFHNGNKRTGLVATLVFLDENDIIVTSSEDELFRLVVKIAQHGLVAKDLDQRADRETIEIAKWLRSNTRPVERSEKLIKWHKLRHILGIYGCTFSFPSVGNRINIERKIEDRLLFLKRERVLKTQTAYGGDGREVERDTLRKIRRDLFLDEDHGVDSEVFYAGAAAATDFIATYRKTLKRLAKL
jgi:death-on-curing family protein